MLIDISHNIVCDRSFGNFTQVSSVAIRKKKLFYSL